MSSGVTRDVYHKMSSYTWGVGGTGLRQGFKCSCGWYISENDVNTARQHLELESSIQIMNDEYNTRIQQHKESKNG